MECWAGCVHPEIVENILQRRSLDPLHLESQSRFPRRLYQSKLEDQLYRRLFLPSIDCLYFLPIERNKDRKCLDERRLFREVSTIMRRPTEPPNARRSHPFRIYFSWCCSQDFVRKIVFVRFPDESLKPKLKLVVVVVVQLSAEVSNRSRSSPNLRRCWLKAGWTPAFSCDRSCKFRRFCVPSILKIFHKRKFSEIDGIWNVCWCWLFYLLMSQILQHVLMDLGWSGFSIPLFRVLFFAKRC